MPQYVNICGHTSQDLPKSFFNGIYMYLQYIHQVGGFNPMETY